MSYNPEFKNDLYNRYYRMMERRKSQMTRKEANQKIKNKGHIQGNDYILDVLETLGLIKFEEEKQSTPFEILEKLGYNAGKAMILLEQAGYKIVRKDAP